jgi:RNA polymerase sigma-70 factor (ECF subfamily)
MKRLSFKPYSDEELMSFASKGDKKAFEEIYDRYQLRIKLFFRKALWNDTELAEDLSQELFIKVIKNLKKYDSRRSFKTWLYSMANNMCKNEYRHRDVKERAADELKQATIIRMHKGENKLDKQIFKEELEKALDDLDYKKRTCFILRFKHDLSISEIAEIEECSEGTIKSRLFYTLKSLAETLQPFNPKQNHG